MIVALAAILSVTLTAGSCQRREEGDEPPPDAGVSYEEPQPTPAGSEDPYNRQNVVPVPKGTSPRAVEFVDANTGYALFSSCVSGQPCQVGLVLTLDGGSSWVARELPFSDATEVELRLGRGNVLILKAAPDGYFISRDNGRTFVQRPITSPPPELGLADPQYRAGCPDQAASACPDRQLLQVGDNGVATALPGRPAAGDHSVFTSLVAQDDGKLWASTQMVDTAVTPPVATVSVWSSTDHGKNWRSEGAVHPPDATAEPHLAVAPDGSDVWLAGARFAARRTPSGWTEAAAMREITELFSAEVLPAGALLVATSMGVWVLDLQQRVRDAGARLIFRLRRLADGTILGYPAQQSGDVWLCTPQSRKCDWSRVAVSAR